MPEKDDISLQLEKHKKECFLETKELVSVVIPCYNHAKYLPEAVESALNQTYGPIEVLIVNDGSSDNTESVAQGLKKKYPHQITVFNQKNAGLSAARNKGIENAIGKYVVPLDADDILHEEMVQKCMEILYKENADIVHPDTQLFGTANETWSPLKDKHCHPLYRSCWVATSLFKKEVWEKTDGYKTNMAEGYEDMEFWVNAYKHNFNFSHCPETLFYYRKKSESMYVDALKKDTYLKAKISLNHPEMYPIYYIHKSIKVVKDYEQSPDFYFYCTDRKQASDKKLFLFIDDYLQSNILKEGQILKYEGTHIALHLIDQINDKADTDTLSHQYNTEYIVFYSAIRHHISFLHESEFAWSEHNGIIAATGSVFPFVPRDIRENPHKQLTAYERLVKYLDLEMDELKKECRVYKESVKNTLEQLFEINDELKKECRVYKESVKNTLEQLFEINAVRHPIRKYCAYKALPELLNKKEE